MKGLVVCIVLVSVLAVIGCGSAPKQAVIPEQKELTVNELVARAEQRIEQLKADQEECRVIIRTKEARAKGIERAYEGAERNKRLEELANDIENRAARIDELQEQIEEQEEFLEKLRAQL